MALRVCCPKSSALLLGSLCWLLCLALPGDARPASPQPVRLLFTGDNLLGGRIGTLIAKHGPAYPYAAIQPVFAGADLRFGNLECPLTTATEATPGKSADNIAAGIEFVFKADPVLGARALRQAGFDVVSLANNHAMDYQAAGMRETLQTLDIAGIEHVGGGRNLAQARAPVILEFEGQRIGILGASMVNPIGCPATAKQPGIWALPKAWNTDLANAIAALEPQCDYLILTLHWGIESTTVPTTYQETIAAKAIAAGVDLVVGHHPHVLQPIEALGAGHVAYSLGNFCFSGKAPQLASAILEVTLPPNGAPELRLIPILVKGGIPEPTTDAATLRLLGQLAPEIPLDCRWAEDALPNRVQSPR